MNEVKVSIPDTRLRDMLVGAFEGGSNYWYSIYEHVFPDGITYADFREGGKYTVKGDYYHPTQLIPFVEGCGLLIGDVNADPNEENADFQPVLLNREALQKGIQVMAEKFPHHFAALMEENDDASTADVFLQCCLFGDVVFG